MVRKKKKGLSGLISRISKHLSSKKGRGSRTRSLFVPTVNKRWVHK